MNDIEVELPNEWCDETVVLSRDERAREILDAAEQGR